MSYTWYSHREDMKANLPGEGERLVFGMHRLAFDDRDCPAWPKNPDAKRAARYRSWINGAKKDPRYLLAIARRQVERAEQAA